MIDTWLVVMNLPLFFIQEKEQGMLVLSRKVGERILIGNDIEILVVAIRSDNKVRLGITAPQGVQVDRLEVRLEKNNEAK